MYVYYFNAISAVFYRLIFSGSKNTRRFVFVGCLQMFIILSIRADTFGSDARAYIRMYDITNMLSLRDILDNFSFFQTFPLPPNVESGYVLMNWICAKLGLSYHAYIMILAFIDCYCMYVFLREFSYSPLLGTLMFQTMTLSWVYLLRRTMAMNFVFLTFVALKKRQYIRSTILLIIAVTMHRIALMSVFYPLLSRIKITKKLFRKAFFVLLAFLIFLPAVMSLVSMILNALGKGGYMTSLLVVPGTLYARIILAAICFFGIYAFVDFKQFEMPENAKLGAAFFLYLPFLAISLIAPSAIAGAGMLLIIPIFVLMTNLIVKYKYRPITYTLYIVTFTLLAYWIYFHFEIELSHERIYMTVWD